MHASTAVGIRCSLCVVGLLLIVVASASHCEEARRKPRVAPWEIEPTDETKRRIDDDGFFIGGGPQIVISARLGERLAVKFKRPPLSIQVRDPGKAAVTWNGKENAELHGLTMGITTITIHYPASYPGGEHETIRYLIRVHMD